MRAFREASRTSRSIVLIEGAEYGTTCARVGCMPSKLLIAAAEAACWGTHAEPFGVSYGPRQIDGTAVMRGVREERDRFVGFVAEAVESWPAELRIKASARFKSDHELELGNGETVVADRTVLATGSQFHVPATLNQIGEGLKMNEDVFKSQELLQLFIVFNNKIIWRELSQALHRLGVRGARFGRGNLVGTLTDPAVLAAAQSAFSREFELHPDGEVTRHTHTETGVEIDYVVEGFTRTAQFDYALVATGRRPKVDHFELGNT